MSENQMDDLAPHLAPPVTRERVRSAAEVGSGADLAIAAMFLAVPPCFADDEAE